MGMDVPNLSLFQWAFGMVMFALSVVFPIVLVAEIVRWIRGE